MSSDSLRKNFSSGSSKTSKSAKYPPHHTNKNGTAFKNPWPSAAEPTWTELAAAPFAFGWATPSLHTHEKAREIKVIKPTWGQRALGSSTVVGTWLGHAGVLVEMPIPEVSEGSSNVGPASKSQEKTTLWMLFDPIFSTRAGPTQWTGPKRFQASPCQVSDLPGCDIVFISHNHYDHLDLSSILLIRKKFPSAKYFVPLGNKRWFLDTGVPGDLVYELDWWDHERFSPQDFGASATLPRKSAADAVSFKVTCTPAQHNSGRTGTDFAGSLWCGWAVERFVRVTTKEAGDTKDSITRKGAIYHAGDTGYRRFSTSPEVCPAFEEIGQKLGPFDLSFIPIWRGGSLSLISTLGLRLSHHDIPATFHCTPTDAVAIHQDVKSRTTVGIHFGTFVGSQNESLEAVIEFAEACKDQSVRDLDEVENSEDSRAGTLDIGGSIEVNVMPTSTVSPGL